MSYNALNIYLSDETKDKLRTDFRGVLENIESKTLAMQLRSTDLSGNPKGGRLIIKKWANFESNPYGTAATAGKGDALVFDPAYIDIDDDREIIKDIERKDAELYDVDALVSKTGAKAQKTLDRELDAMFLEYASDEATEYTPGEDETEIIDIFDGAVAQLNNLKNDYIDGVEDEDICVVADAKTYKELRRYLDKVSNPVPNSEEGTVRTIHDIDVYKSSRMPSGTGMLVMIKNIIGLPLLAPNVETEKIKYRNAVSVQYFYSVGVGTATPEGILKVSVTP